MCAISNARRNRPRVKISRVTFHLKINTGMNRLGLLPSELDAFASALADCRHIELEGTFTHFASAEDFSARQTDEQEETFRKCLDRMRALGISPGIVHMANSGAICARPSTWADMVRPGAILYGYYQSFDPPEKGQEVSAACRSSRASRCARASSRCAICRRAAGGLRRALCDGAAVAHRGDQRGLCGRHLCASAPIEAARSCAAAASRWWAPSPWI